MSSAKHPSSPVRQSWERKQDRCPLFVNLFGIRYEMTMGLERSGVAHLVSLFRLNQFDIRIFRQWVSQESDHRLSLTHSHTHILSLIYTHTHSISLSLSHTSSLTLSLSVCLSLSLSLYLSTNQYSVLICSMSPI